MDEQNHILDSKKKIAGTSSKLSRQDSNTSTKSSSLSKLAKKITRKKSFKNKNKERKEGADDQVFLSTEDPTPISPDIPISPTDTAVPVSPHLVKPTLVPLSKSISKSEDSLDSGIYSRQKSCDSVESLDSTGSSAGVETQPTSEMSYITVEEDLSIDDQKGSMNSGQYEDYWRECQDIRQSIIVHSDDDFEDKRSVSKADSGDDDDEGDWLRRAGLADLVASAAIAQNPSHSQEQSANSANTRLSTDSLTSMTILSTLTRPQREAVLRRITSFNRAQKTKRRPKRHINAVFSNASSDESKNSVEAAGKPPLAPPPVEITLEQRTMSESNKNKSTSLPHNIHGFTTSEPYHRRYSEIHHRTDSSALNETDNSFLSTSMISAYSTPALDTGRVMKLDQKGYQRKEPLSSIVATESTAGIETLSIHSRSSDDANWQSHGENFAEDGKSKPMSYSETADQENLPNFSLVKDRLGITRISDLSLPDVRKVQSLALIELTALFDLHSIELKRRKFGKTKTRETGLFGIPLTMLLEWDQKRQNDSNLRIPLVLHEIITFIEQNGLSDEGILRVPGSAVRIKNLKQELEHRFSQSSPVVLLDPNAGWKEARTNDVAALLKQFLRELPNPLLTLEYIDAFQSCDLIPDRKQQLQALNLLIILLHDVHRDSLKLLLKFLSRVVSKEEANKMSLNNVAMIMAPNLFMAKKQSKRGEVSSVLSANQDVKHAAGTSNIVRMLIKYHKLLWTVPTFMLTQVRNMNQAENSSKKHHSQSKDKLKLKFFPQAKSKDLQAKMSKSPIASDQFDYEVPKGVIRVKVEKHSMTSMAVQLDPKTNAGNVIAKFQRQCERARQQSPDSDITVITNDTHALYEVGGNINERCLDPGTNMHALVKINPDATWIIKTRTNT